MHYLTETTALLKECILSGATPVWLDSTGNSMHPFIKEGDSLHIQAAPLNKLTIGDIIVYEQEGALISHRLLIPGKRMLLIKADINFAPDPAVRNEAIVGKIAGIRKTSARGAIFIDLHAPAWRLKMRIMGIFHLGKYLLWRLLKPVKTLFAKPAAGA